MIAFDPSFFRDTISVVGPVRSADVDGGPTQSDGSATTLSASVQETVSTSQATRRDEPYQGAIAGETYYEILTPTNPGITAADTKIKWTANAAGPINPPIVLTSQGPARPPRGLGVRWTVSAKRVG